MIKVYNFSLKKLKIDQQKIAAVLGYPDDKIQEPFDQCVEEHRTECQ